MFLRNILTLTEKDLRIEIRSRESIFATLLFVLLSLFIFNFSFGINPKIIQHVAPGIIWVIIAFSGTLAIGHLAQRDFEDRALDGLLMSGMGGSTIFLSRFVTSLVFMMWIEFITVGLFLLFFNFDLGPWVVNFVMILSLGTIGYAAVGTFFAALVSHARARNILYPVVFYPVIIPLLIAAVQGTAAVMRGEMPKEIMLLLGFDIIFVSASILLFDFVIEDPS